MLHAKSACKRRVCFDDDAVLFANLPDILSSVERVHFDLIDCRHDARLRIHELLDMRHPKVRNAANLDFAGTDCILDSAPGISARGAE